MANRTAIVVPGIMATRLVLGDGAAAEEVWPPTPLETKFGYDRIGKLTDPATRPGGLIDNVLSFQFYSTLKQQLSDAGFARTDGPRMQVDFPYDWRQDLIGDGPAGGGIVHRLADFIDEIDRTRGGEYLIFAHSMGGLITRLLLESGLFEDRAWFDRITLYAALAVPHLGAPLALARIFGIDATLGISGADFRKLVSDRRYPSGYQLIPAPGEAAIWDLASDDVATLDPYADGMAERLGLDPWLVDRAGAVHRALDPSRAPETCRYVYFAGVGKPTVTRVNVSLGAKDRADHADSLMTKTKDAGDGTVPLFSALPHRGQRHMNVNEHSVVFDSPAFRRMLFRLVGSDAGPVLEAEEAQGLILSLDSPVQRAGGEIPLSLTVSPPDPMMEEAGSAERIVGALVLSEVGEDGRPTGETAARIEVRYEGPAVPGLSLSLPAPEPGLYRLDWEGEPSAANQARFAVSTAGGG